MTTEQAQKSQKKPSMLANLAFNIIIPTLIMTKLSSEDYLGPVYSIVVALSFPIIYGAKDYLENHKANFFSALGILSVVLTGGISLLQLDPQYIAIKEAAIPACFGLATLFSVRTKYPLVKTFLFNDQILQIGKVKAALEANNTEQARVLMPVLIIIIAIIRAIGSFMGNYFIKYVGSKIRRMKKSFLKKIKSLFCFMISSKI